MLFNKWIIINLQQQEQTRSDKPWQERVPARAWQSPVTVNFPQIFFQWKAGVWLEVWEGSLNIVPSDLHVSKEPLWQGSNDPGITAESFWVSHLEMT